MRFNTYQLPACLAGLLLVGVLASLACAQNRPAPGPPGKPPASPVKVEVKTDKKQYGVKEPVKMTLTATNTTQATIPLHFSSTQKYDFEIKQGKDTKGASLWKWSKGMMFGQIMQSSKLDPGKPLTFTETYAPGAKSAEGTPLPALSAGTYTVVATLTTAGNATRPQATVTFTVK